MARKARKDEFLPDEVNVYHCFNRTVRRSYLHGLDPLTGVDYSHRRAWFLSRMKFLAGSFCIDVLALAILSNHWHCVLRNRPDLVKKMTNREAALRWLTVTYRKKTRKNPTGRPTDAEINSIVNNPEKMAEIRKRLSDISWFVRLMCQTIARQCNLEDECTGRFFEERFKLNRLDDEADVLACMAYVDLNPVRARVTDRFDDPDWHVSIGERLRGLNEEAADSSSWLAPLELAEEVNCQPVVVANDVSATEMQRHRESKQRLGCLPMKLEDYERLLWHLALESRPELQASHRLTAEKLRSVPTLRGQAIDLARLQETLEELQQRCDASLGQHTCKAIRERLALRPMTI